MGQELHTFFDGQVEIQFTEKGHKYHRRVQNSTIEIDDVKTTIPNCTPGEWELIPSASKIAKGAFDKIQLSNWLVDISLKAYQQYIAKGLTPETALDKAKGHRWKKMNAAAKIGSAVHDWIHLNILREMGKIDYDPEFDESNKKVYDCIQAFIEWEANNVEEYLATEVVVYNPWMDTVGTMDFAARVKDGTINCYDCKTGTGVYEADFMQVAFYRKAFEMCYGISSEQAILLHFENKNRIKEYPANDPEVNADAFECASFLYRWKDNK